MITESLMPLAASSTGSLWLITAGIVVVAALLAAFIVGSRRAARRRVPTPSARPQTPGTTRAPQSGDGWQTPAADPEQGHPRRPDND
ncbi:DUF6479 family protein [Streptomyces sp. NPDC000983]|uniref:DUF6479 family protein n=1 Tax=Streptomyces sp. NPDC000983 TaxID=3154373 RepID=UPI00332E584B